MRLLYNKYNILAESFEGRITTIILENPKTYSDFIKDLNGWVNGDESSIELYEDDGALMKNTKSRIVWNPFLVQMNMKSVMNKIYKELEQISKEEFWEKEQELNSEIINYLDELLLKLPYPLEYSLELKIEEVLKMYRISFSEEYESILEKLCNYVKIISQVCGLKCLFFLNLHDFLSLEEVEELIKIANYHKIRLFCIESHQRKRLENEHTYLLDEWDNIIRF